MIDGSRLLHSGCIRTSRWSQVADLCKKYALTSLVWCVLFGAPTPEIRRVISRGTIENKHYADEAIWLAVQDRKTYFEMEQFAAHRIPDPALFAYFMQRIKAMLN